MFPKPRTKMQSSERSTFYRARIMLVVLALLLSLSALVLLRVPDLLRGSAYGLFREIARQQMILKTNHWAQLEDDLFLVRYQGSEKSARLVLDSARQYYYDICYDLGYLPKHQILVLVYASREELNSSFGWSASENAMGVYWGGAIRVLAPEAWIGDPDAAMVEQIFMKAGPMAHELTHYVLDYAACGNYPRWFTEGLAQYQEYKMTGVVLDLPQVDGQRQQLYRLADMDRNFDALPSQANAYRQSLAAVEYIVEVYGETGLNNIITSLAQGEHFSRALERSLGLNLEAFEVQWRQWMAIA